MSSSKPSPELTLIILPTEQLKKIDLLSKTDWQYVESINSVTNEDDIDESLIQIKKFYGPQNDL